MPEVIPVTTPLVSPIVATNVLLLLHVPPEVVSNKVIVDPAQTVDGPEIAAGPDVMEIDLVTKQPDT